MPELGGENVLGRLSTKRRKYFNLAKMIEPDQLKRQWKEKREHQLQKRKIIRFSPETLIYELATQNAMQMDPTRLIMSVHIQYDPELRIG